MLAADLNPGHLATQVLDRSGNPAGKPHTIGLEVAELPAATRDARIRAAVTDLLKLAKANGCQAIAIENLDFADARYRGRDQAGRRPARGAAGRRFRGLVSGIPTARFRDRLAQMSSRAGISVMAVDPAYTSKWGAQHWLAALKKTFAAGQRPPRGGPGHR